jgi:hypothetical protein
VKKCGREGLNVGFPPLTHDRVPVSETKTRYPVAVAITVHFYTFRKIVPETPISVRDRWGAAADDSPVIGSPVIGSPVIVNSRQSYLQGLPTTKGCPN